jgi:hypothetical protein
MISGDSLVLGVVASEALFIVSSLSRELPKFPKRSVAPGARATPTSISTIRNLENLVAERARSLPGGPIVGVLYFTPTSKFIVRILGSGVCAWRAKDLYLCGQNVPTSIHWWLELPAPLMIKLVVGATSSRERERRGSQISYWGGSGA